MSTSHSLSSEIDRLLEHYLALLDQYTTFRTQLSSQQISTQQHLARAKFHAPPGIQYGESMYDGRMQAQRFLQIKTGDTDGISFEVKKEGSSEEVSEKEKYNKTSAKEDENEKTSPSSTKDNERVKRGKDPIRMFGYSIPSALKSAQVEAIKMVESSIPQICAVNAEMMEVEIKIRRARKQRVKAEEKELKERLGTEKETVEVSGVSIEV